MAPVCRQRFMVAAIAISSILFAAHGQLPGRMAIKNNLSSNLKVDCASESLRPPVRTLRPGDAYQFNFNTETQASWSCTFIRDPVTLKSGTFLMWTQQPGHAGLCERNCPWFAGVDGLSLIKCGGCAPEHIYNWK